MTFESTAEGSRLAFWCAALSLSAFELENPRPLVTTGGTYIERHGDAHVFLYEDLENGKKVLSLSEANLKRLFPGLRSLESFPPDRAEVVLSKLQRGYEDVDYYLPQNGWRAPRPPAPNLCALEAKDEPDISKFLSQISKEETDVLDLELGEDYAVATYDPNGEIEGIARSCPIRVSPQLADITVVTRSQSRGKGLATNLVAGVLQFQLARGLFPKYRVKIDNVPSRRVAERLGLVAGNLFTTWKVEP